MSEFDIIERYFLPLTEGQVGTAQLKDDAAILSVPEHHELVITSDTLNEGIHFLKGEAPENIAHKALRVNLSDLASMGATPLSYQLNIAFPNPPKEEWLKKFTSALAKDNQSFNIFCSGGDTTSIKGDHLSISITALGTVEQGRALRRSGAQDGDVLVITGEIGDACLGLKVLQGGLNMQEYPNAIARYQNPQPRLSAAAIIQKYAHAAIDISDGLLADCAHIAKASNLCVEIDFDHLVFSEGVRKALKSNVINETELVTGGDDYELALAVPAKHAETVLAALRDSGLSPFVLGRFQKTMSKQHLKIKNNSIRIDLNALGWQHF